jgi:hypothetical protein
MPIGTQFTLRDRSDRTDKDPACYREQPGAALRPILMGGYNRTGQTP